LPFVDDPTISDAEILLRRIPHPAETTLDPKAPNGLRPRSSAFDPNRDGTPMSVQRLAILDERGLDPVSEVLGEFFGWGIVSFSAGSVRAFGKGVAPDANDVDGPAHAVVEDLTGGQKRQLAKLCQWVRVPDGYVQS
jgi:hypothetical protein